MNAVIETKDDVINNDMYEIPNAVTLAAMQEADDMISGKKLCTWYHSSEDLINALNNETDS